MFLFIFSLLDFSKFSSKIKYPKLGYCLFLLVIVKLLDIFGIRSNIYLKEVLSFFLLNRLEDSLIMNMIIQMNLFFLRLICRKTQMRSKQFMKKWSKIRPNIGPSYDVSGLHNKQRRHPVNPADVGFSKKPYQIYSISIKRWKPKNCSWWHQAFSYYQRFFVFLSINTFDYFYFPLSILFIFT